MTPTPPTLDQSINYLLGIDTTEHWCDSIAWTPSPEDWGNICVDTIAKMVNPSLDAIAALMFGAMHSEIEELRHTCAVQLRESNALLGALVMYLQTFDSDDNIVEYALDALCDEAPGDDWTLANSATTRILEHNSAKLRQLALLCQQKMADRSAEP